MRIRHILHAGSARKDDAASGTFFLRGGGGFLALRPERNSRYDGWFIENTSVVPSRLTKLIERIAYVKDGGDVAPEPPGITVTGDAAFWEYGDGAKIGFKLAQQHAGMQIKASRPCGLKITLDVRGAYQLPGLGRTYSATRVAGGISVKYQDGEIEAPVYLHFSCSEFFQLDGSWNQAEYPWDAGRNSSPSSLYVYELGAVATEKLSIGAGATPEEAQAACNAASRLPLEVVGIGVSYAEDDLDTAMAIAREGATRALDWLKSPHGTYAGLPWFHQVWSRDELIAALGMGAEGQREIIQRYIGLPLQEGELPTFAGSGTTCADGVGWFCLLLKEHGVHHLSEAGRNAIADFLAAAREGLKKHRAGEHGFIRSGHNATWMDTIGREGYRLDVQCMYALLLELLGELTGGTVYEDERLTFLAQLREHFFLDGYLADGLSDATKRPNVFIAYLLQPELLTEEQWKSCFATVIAALSTPWGGLTSLDTEDPAFQADSTGENNLSYHNGDSWFFVNNLAGAALQRCDSRVYAQTISRIVRSSTDEILWKNFLGLPGEIASASDGTSWGCGVQGFSAGAYVFLLDELRS